MNARNGVARSESPNSPERNVPMRAQTTWARRLFSGGVWAAVGRAVSVPSFLLLNLYLVRTLSQFDYAVYALTLILVAFLSVLATLGLPPTMVRVLRESLTCGDAERARASLRYCFGWVLLACVVVPPFYLALTPWFGSEEIGQTLRHYAPWILAWICLAGVTQVAGEVFRGFENFRWSAILSGQNGGAVPNVSALTIIVVGSFFRPLDLHFVLGAQIVAMSIPLLLGSLVLRQMYREIDRSIRTDAILAKGLVELTPVRLLRLSAPLLATTGFAVCLSHVDLFLLGGFAPTDEVATYGAIRRLMALVAAPMLLANVILPSFVADLHAQGRKRELERLLRSTATLAGMPALLVLVALIAFPGPLLSSLFGPEYASGVAALAMLAVANIAFVLCGSSDLALMMAGCQTKLLRISVLTGVTYLSIAPWIIARHGMVGAAAASAALIVTHNVLAMASVKRYVGVWSVASVSPALIRDSLRWIWRGGMEVYRGKRSPVTSTVGDS